MWGLRWTKLHWGRFSPTTSVSPANHSTIFSIIIVIRGWHNRTLVTAVASEPNWTPPLTTPIKKLHRTYTRLNTFSTTHVTSTIFNSYLHFCCMHRLYFVCNMLNKYTQQDAFHKDYKCLLRNVYTLILNYSIFIKDTFHL
jgi:hypothetical protein